MWTIWTERIHEAPRQGMGDDTFRDTLDHLRRRGDQRVRFQREAVDPVTVMELQGIPTEPRPLRGAQRSASSGEGDRGHDDRPTA